MKVWRERLTYRVLAVEMKGDCTEVALGVDPAEGEREWGKDWDMVTLRLPVGVRGMLEAGKVVKLAVEVEAEKEPFWKEVLSEW